MTSHARTTSRLFRYPAGPARRYLLITAAVVLAGAAGLTGGPAKAATLTHVTHASAGWGNAVEVAGIAALNTGGYAITSSVSCASAGNCAAGGYYTAGGKAEPFVLNQAGGVWAKAEEVPGITALNRSDAEIDSVSCRSAGYCSAGGDYTDSAGHDQVFVVSEAAGSWGKAAEVPGTAALNTDGAAQLRSVSCASAGNCAAGGYYTAAHGGGQQPFVADQVKGRWETAVELPGIAALNTGGIAALDSVSCASAGNCGAGGYYTNSAGASEPFVVSQVNGVWGDPVEVPGINAPYQGIYGSQVNSVSCASAGNCAAGGYYTDSANQQQGFVVSEVKGGWGNAETVTGPQSDITSVSCGSAGNCSAGGSLTGSSGPAQAVVLDEVSGVWGQPALVPGSAALNTGGNGASVTSVSCGSAGNCSAVGSYTDRAELAQMFVVSEATGVWRNAAEVPGTRALNSTTVTAASLSCAPAPDCAAGGSYLVKSTVHTEAFVVSRT